MTLQKLVLSNGDQVATLTMDGPNIALFANGNISLEAKGNVDIKAGNQINVTAGGGDLTLKGGPMVKINC
jgi:uncharacterized protein (DUF2345 family)